jgi:hypothetical protein
MSCRKPTVVERSLIDRLLSAEFPGKDELVSQATDALVEPIDTEGSLRFEIKSSVRAPTQKRVPVEAQCADEDEVSIHALLHVVDGKLAELEIYKDDSSPIRRLPQPKNWEVVVLH